MASIPTEITLKFCKADLQALADLVAEKVQKSCVIPTATVAGTDGLLNVRGAADYLGASESFLHRLTARRGIPVVKIGSANRFRRSDLDKWITKNTEKAAI